MSSDLGDDIKAFDFEKERDSLLHYVHDVLSALAEPSYQPSLLEIVQDEADFRLGHLELSIEILLWA